MIAGGNMSYFKCEAPDYTHKAKPGKRIKVDLPISVSYNGGTVIDGKWYAGYEVPKPIVPDGYELVSSYSGAQYNAHPPTLEMYLQPKGKR